MNHTKEEIRKALHVIKDECTDTDCPACPFSGFSYNAQSTNTHCMLRQNNPAQWDINDEEPVWKALK